MFLAGRGAVRGKYLPMTKITIPTVITHDVKSFRCEDTPDEMIDALEIELADMGEEGQRIVAAGNEIAGVFPSGLTRDELSAWMKKTFGW